MSKLTKLPAGGGTDRDRAVDACLHPLRVRLPRRLRRGSLPQAEEESGRQPTLRVRGGQAMPSNGMAMLKDLLQLFVQFLPPVYILNILENCLTPGHRNAPECVIRYSFR